jgi:predicted naringenin-chalcone synthase
MTIGSRMAAAYVNAIGTATPPHDVHAAFRDFCERSLSEPRERVLFARMAQRAGIEHRFSDFRPVWADGRAAGDAEGFYAPGRFPSTAERMRRFEDKGPALALSAIGALPDPDAARAATHLVVASCTGFVAPGLDQMIVAACGLDPSVERTVVGFMGCYAAVSALRLAHHFVRSAPAARVLVVNVELCTLHFQEQPDLEKALAMLLFADGATAALVSAEPHGLELIDFKAATIADSADSITWKIGDAGFDMYLSGEVPARIARALADIRARNDDTGLLRGRRSEDFDLWAVHAGGRTILDAVEAGFELAPCALSWSRGVLRDYGNMSSATLMFILERILTGFRPAAGGPGDGFAVAFGPGLAAESFRFRMAV